MELRTHQPGIEALIDTDNAPAGMTEDEWGDKTGRRLPIPWGWFALIGMAIIAAIVWSLAHLQDSVVVAKAIRDETVSNLAKDEAEAAEALKLIERIEGTLKIFFDTSSVDLKARMIRQPERVRPLMFDHYERFPHEQSPMKEMRSLEPLNLHSSGDFWISSVMLANGKVINLVIEIDRNGNPLMDWETMVCYQPMAWDKFARQRPTGRSLDFRVVAVRDHFHSHEFTDQEKWTSYRLSALDSDEVLFGYVATGTEAELRLAQLAEIYQGAGMNVMLRLNIPDGLTSRRGVVIEKVLNSRWIYVDPPDNES
jgi:hypothetical protein